MKYFKWPREGEAKPVTVIDYSAAYPSETDEFAGLFGYQMSFYSSKFLKGSNRFYIFSTEIRGQSRIYLADMEQPGRVKWLNFLGKEAGAFREG